MSVPKPFYILLLTLAIVLGGHAVRLQAKTLVPPDDPTQSITYWKPYAIAPDKDPLAAKAQSVFAVLLRAWDSTRLEPSLYVVDSTAGPWAASLADGNILLSRDAIKTCMNFGKERADHLLAFVLAHELAHQRSDDLWHQRFFRLIGAQAPDTRATLIQKLQLDTKMLSNLEQKEAQADHDGLITMASVGYDPYQILDKKDFFTAWVENIWQNSCSAIKQNTALQEACEQAQTRALRTRTQLTGVATQSMLYELGVQSFIAGDYAGARRYFKAYGRDYPSRAVLSALGSTHLAQAVEIYHTMVRNKWLDRPAFYYPMLLDATAAASPVDTTGEGKRAAADVAANQLKREMKQHLNSSIEYFDKAIRLEPNHKKSYLLLAAAYLLDGNTFMARGVIQGQYTPKFRQDLSADLLLAMTSALENRASQAEQEFGRLIRNLRQDESNSPIPLDVLTYTAYYNNATYAEFRGDPAKGEKLPTGPRKGGRGYCFVWLLTKFAAGLPRHQSLPRHLMCEANAWETPLIP